MTNDDALVLTSWKEIANHLQVTVRTAQLWEKQRDLPVRRVPGRRSSSGERGRLRRLASFPDAGVRRPRRPVVPGLSAGGLERGVRLHQAATDYSLANARRKPARTCSSRPSSSRSRETRPRPKIPVGVVASTK